MNKPIHIAALLGWLLVIGGVAGILYFSFAFDSSIGVAENPFGIERVQNFGLMNDRQTGIIVSGLAIVVGVIILIARWIVASKQILPPPQNNQPVDSEKINAELEKRRTLSPKELEWTLKKFKERQK